MNMDKSMKTAKTTDNTNRRPFAPKFRGDPSDGPNGARSETTPYNEYGKGVVFEDDASDGAAYLETIRRNVAFEPERHLMLAILEDAIVAFQKNLYTRTAKKRVLFEEAEAWILDEKDYALFSFESICDVLGIEADYLRRGLMGWKKGKAKTRTAAPAKAA